jgi:hypothetical protein
MLYHITWTTHKGGGGNPPRQVTETFTRVHEKVQKAGWLAKNNIPYITHFTQEA